MHLLYVTFGKNIANHIQAQFSILTFWADSNQVQSINIITDQPALYANINDRVNVIEVTEQTLGQWKGPHDFFWRIKIKAIEKICGMYPNQPVMYLDTDTFLYNGFSGIAEQVMQGQAFMHENEGSLSADRSKTAKRMFTKISTVSYGGVVINSDHCMWNAGVVLTPNTKQNKECLLALEICDQMCQQGVTRRLIEQFALSVALQEVYGLQPAAGAIAHYWSNKEHWNRAIEAFLLTANFKGLSVDETIHALREFDFHIPIKMRVRNTNLRLKSLADHLYPPQNPLYIDYHL